MPDETARAVTLPFPPASLSGHGWTPERIALLKTLWVTEALPASQIAKRLGGVSRCAVIGKARRIGLPPHSEAVRRANITHAKREARTTRSATGLRAPAVKRDPAQNAATTQRLIAAASPKTPLIIAGNGAVIEKPPGHEPRTPESFNRKAWEPLAGTEPVTIMGLTDKTCHWPVELADQAEAHFCGLDVQGDRYCSHHAVVGRSEARPATVKDLFRSLRRVA